MVESERWTCSILVASRALGGGKQSQDIQEKRGPDHRPDVRAVHLVFGRLGSQPPPSPPPQPTRGGRERGGRGLSLALPSTRAATLYSSRSAPCSCQRCAAHGAGHQQQGDEMRTANEQEADVANCPKNATKVLRAHWRAIWRRTKRNCDDIFS